jgi:very-short-patch-repair endonuclease
VHPERKRIRTSEHVHRYARELRQKLTPLEKILWSRLRNRQLSGLKFRRQHPLGPFIVDFYCAAHRLAVEIDGGIHDTRTERDVCRTEQLQAYAYPVIRFHNEQVLSDLDGVLAAIRSACLEFDEADPVSQGDD